MPVNAIQLWEFPVQWSDKFTVVSTFKTEIISSFSGKEQRRAMRVYPRRAFSFKLDALPSLVDELQFFMTTAQRNVVVMPEPVRRQRTVSALGVGQSVLDVDAIAPWMTEGGYVALLGDGEVQVLQISDIFDRSLAFTEAAARPWPRDTRIVPAWKGLLSETVSFTLPTSRVMQGGIDFSVLPGEEIDGPPEPDIENMIYGRELFGFRTNWADAQSIDYAQTRNIVDYDRGVTALFTPVAYAAKSYSTDILNFDPEQAYALTSFFERMKGRRGEFLFSPPGRAQMQLALDYVQGDTVLLVKGDAPRRAYIGDPTIRILAITMRKTGLTHYRKVASAMAVASGDTRLTFDLPIPEIISADTVKSVSWVSVARFESDELTVDWLTTTVSQARVVIRALEYVEPEDVVDFDEGTQWLLGFYGAAFAVQFILDPLLIVLNVKEPHFALVVDEGTQYLIDEYGRGTSDRFILDGTNRVLNVVEPRFAEA